MHAYRNTYLFWLAAAALCLSGCTSLSDYVHHGFKVGPEYGPPRPQSRRSGSTPPISASAATPPT